MRLQTRSRGLDWPCSGSQSVYPENRITLVYDDHARLLLTRSLTTWAFLTGPGNEVFVDHSLKLSMDGLVADMLMQPLSTNRQQNDVRMP